MTFKQKLIELRACNVAIEWAADKTIEEVWQTCERGDWMLWLAQRADIDTRTLTLAKARCAELAIPYMTDERSINAVKVALAFGRGEATMEELKAAAYAAYAAADAAADARKETLKKCADIVREVISAELIKANLNTINE